MTIENNDEIIDPEGKQQQHQQQPPPPIRNIVVGSSNINNVSSNPSPNNGVKNNKNNNKRVIDSTNGGTVPIIDTTFHRVVHKVRLSALEHNYSEVESVANRQKCSVIVVVKADGYGHGSIPTAIYLADKIGADAFAVATLQEGITLRKALQETASTTPGYNDNINHYFNFNVASQTTVNNTDTTTAAAAVTRNSIILNQYHRRQSTATAGSNEQQQDSLSLMTGSDFSGSIYGGIGGGGGKKRRSLRQAHIRILVLGPPVGFPRCFDDYYHYNIEVMISGPEVAMALYEWVCNKDERKRLQVERAANDLKERILLDEHEQKLPLNNNNIKNNNNNNNASKRIRGSIGMKTKHQEDNMKSSTARASTAMNSNEGQGETTNKIATAADNDSQASSNGRLSPGSSGSSIALQQQIPSATLTNVTGSDLAREVREILKNQKLAVETQKQNQQQQMLQQQLQQQQKNQQRKLSNISCDQTPLSTVLSMVSQVSSNQDVTVNTAAMTTLTSTFSVCNGVGSSSSGGGTNNGTVQVFAGIEETARHSRIRQKAMSNEVFYDLGGTDDDEDEEDSHHDNNYNIDDTSKNQRKQQQFQRNYDNDKSNNVKQINQSENTSRRIPTNTNRKALPMMAPTKKRLRWHALVDSGMGRLGFRTDPVSKEDQSKRRDSVDILKELVVLEVNLNCPIEFYGMCTHMADASNSTSTYTNSQIKKFKNLLKRVRAAEISVPTISTDNSAALLTTNLAHFDSRELLAQTDADSRGFVRTGGAIYGQRPSFPQLRAVSTLMASVRHVAILKEGESVGYDRVYVALMNVRIATLTIGFADGYPRELGNGVGRVSIRGHLFPIAGNICMDMLMVELGPAGDKNSVGAQVVVGDTAILWGPDDGEEGEGHVRLQDVAATLKTTQSALTCGLNKERVIRQYSY